MKKFLILLAILSLFTASEVGAGCAWVLWSRAVFKDGDGKVVWTILEATGKEEACLESKARRTKLNKEYSLPTSKIAAEFLCLPDTVDPRK